MQQQYGHLAKQYCNLNLPLRVLQSNAGFYLGTADENGPVSRESSEYWKAFDHAQQALETGCWLQKPYP